MSEIEMNQGTVASSDVVESDTSAAPEVQIETPAAPEPAKADPVAPEPTLKEKIQAKAAELAEKRSKNTEKTGKKASESVKSPSPGTPVKQTQSAPKTQVEAPLEGEKPAFEPTFKVKVMDKEQEIPEFLRPLMKDAATQKQVTDLVTKALGLDYVMPKLAEARKQGQQYQGERDQIISQLNEAKQMYSRGDLDSFFKRLAIPEERILQWVADKINYNQLPQEQKQILDARKQAEDRAYAAEQQTTTLQTQHEHMLGQQVQLALESELAKPDVKTVADAFDARMGQAGAFESEIRRRGDYAWKTRNELVPPARIVQELLTFLGPAAPSQPVTQPVAGAAAPVTPNQAPAKTPNVIPNISGRSTSALKPVVKNLDDIRRIHKEMVGASTPKN